MKKYTARIRLPNGATQDVVVNADHQWNAKAMIEAQYGQGSIMWGPNEA